MKKLLILPVILLFLTVLLFFQPLFLKGDLPIPSDTIIGMYHPFRDLYAKEYPRGIPFKNFQITDPVRQQYPWKSLSIDILKKYQLPLWNPYNFSGTPLLANFQSAVFYPLNIVFFLFPLSIGWSVLILLQPLLASTFMYLFLRNLKLSIPASILGSVSFAFCGFFVSWMEWGNVAHTGLWLPLILFAIDKLVLSIKYEASSIQNKNLLLWSSILLFSITSSFFAGHLQVFFYLYLVSSAYFLFRWFESGRSKKVIFLYLLLNALFLTLTAVQWLPTFQFIFYSARGLDQISTSVAGWYVPWQNLMQFIAPDFFGNPSTLNYWGVWNYGEFIGYIGFIPFVLALYAISVKKEKVVWFFFAVFILSLAFMLPTLFAKIPFKFSLPFISTSQPTRLLYLVDVCLPILAAFGLDGVLKKPKKVYIPLIVVGVAVLGSWAFIFFNQQMPTALQVTVDNLSVTKSNLKLPTILYVVSLLIFAFYFIFAKKFKSAKNIVIIAVFLVTIFDLCRFSSKYLTFADQKYLFPQTKILSFLQKEKEPFRVISADSRVFPPNFSIMYKISTPDGYDPLFTRRYAELSAAVSRNQPNISPPFGFNRIITIQNYHSELINMLNVKYVLSLEELHSESLKKVLTEGGTKVYENLEFIPRAFFVENTLRAASSQDSINKIFENSRSLRTTAIVEDPEMERQKAWGSSVIINTKAIITKYEENTVVIDTENNQEGFLVLADSFYPTWHAFVDGKETKIYLTDYNFRGIIVSSGKHTVVFQNQLL